MVKTTSTRKTADAAPEVTAPEVTTEVDLEVKTETPSTDAAEQFFGRWFPVLCECGTTVISDKDEDRGRTITHTEHVVWLGQPTPPEQQVWTSPATEDGTVTPTVVTPKDGKVTLTLEQFEELAKGAGLTKAVADHE